MEEKVKQQFIDLIGQDKINYICNDNWIKFERKIYQIYKENIICINFLEKDGVNDTVIFFSIHYSEDTMKWWSENHIDSPYVMFDSYDDAVSHYKTLEDDHISNGSSIADLP